MRSRKPGCVSAQEQLPDYGVVSRGLHGPEPCCDVAWLVRAELLQEKVKISSSKQSRNKDGCEADDRGDVVREKPRREV